MIGGQDREPRYLFSLVISRQVARKLGLAPAEVREEIGEAIMRAISELGADPEKIVGTWQLIERID